MYNFCCEPGRGYDKKIFNNNVKRFPFKDHHTPSLEMMVEYGRDLKEWLDADEKNVINLHCKAGKGRAGLMCCVALLRSGVVNSAKEAMKLYDSKRVTNNRGLTVTSQKKFVLFYEAIWRKCWGVTENLKVIFHIQTLFTFSILYSFFHFFLRIFSIFISLSFLLEHFCKRRSFKIFMSCSTRSSYYLYWIN